MAQMPSHDQTPSFVPRPAPDQVQEPAGFAAAAEENLSPVHQEVPPHPPGRARLHRPGHPPRALRHGCHGPGDTADQGDRVPRAAAVPLAVRHGRPGRLLWVRAAPWDPDSPWFRASPFRVVCEHSQCPTHRTCSYVVQTTRRNPVPKGSLRRWLGSGQKASEKHTLVGFNYEVCEEYSWCFPLEPSSPVT